MTPRQGRAIRPIYRRSDALRDGGSPQRPSTGVASSGVSCTACRPAVSGGCGLPSVARVSDQQHSDGWEALRARLEASGNGSRLRGGWVPRGRPDRTPPDRSETAAPGVPDAGPATVAVRQQPATVGSPPALTRAHVVVVAVVAAVAVVSTVVVVRGAQPSEQSVPLVAHAAIDPMPTASPTLPEAEPGAGEPVTDPPVADEVVVHVAGKVRRPGVVRLPAGSRVIDAVEAAGGARPRADLTAVNLARELEDGEQVRVDLPPDPALDGVVPTGAGGQGAQAASGGVLDLNTATASDLESLPGIGPVLAQRIVTYRDESGPFRTLEQLAEVSGIGPAVLASVADLVRV